MYLSCIYRAASCTVVVYSIYQIDFYIFHYFHIFHYLGRKVTAYTTPSLCAPESVCTWTRARCGFRCSQCYHQPNRIRRLWIPVSHHNDDDPSDLDRDFQAVGPALHILQLNVEQLSAAKRGVTSSIAERGVTTAYENNNYYTTIRPKNIFVKFVTLISDT